MDISRTLKISHIEELKILSDVRLVSRNDLNPVYSKENLQVQFLVSGQVLGGVTCYLCLDGHELSHSDKNCLYPLFSEAMNILIGKQISSDKQLKDLDIKLSPPRICLNAKEVHSAHKLGIHSYDLELNGLCFCVLTEYSLGALN